MTDFEQAYYAIRKREGRVYTDETLAALPEVPRNHPLAREWRIRGDTLRRVLKDLREPGSPRILDLGCGNGWMSRHFAGIPGARVIAADRVGAELRQARRVFGGLEGLTFMEADIFRDTLPVTEFDRITLGASVQYFPDLPRLVARLRDLLTEEGEIHIFDSPFYKAGEIAAARARTRAYYEKMGFPGLSVHYYHHDIDELLRLGARCVEAPRPAGRLQRLLGKTGRPFGRYVLTR